MTKTCLHCKTDFIESRSMHSDDSCNCGGCYATKEELQSAITWHEKQISELKETLECEA